MQAIAQRRSRAVAAGRESAGAPGSGCGLSSSQSGQSLVEACIVIVILCLVVFCGIQMSQFFVATEVLNHAAISGARARAVGFNEFMVQKTIRAAAVPLAGQMVQPTYSSDPFAIVPAQHRIAGAWNSAVLFAGGSAQFNIEHDAIPLYLGAGDWGQAASYLDYKLDYLNRYGWTDDGNGNITKEPNIQRTVHLQDFLYANLTEDGSLIKAYVTHDFPLNYAFHRALFSGVDVLSITATNSLEKHYDLYLE